MLCKNTPVLGSALRSILPLTLTLLAVLGLSVPSKSDILFQNQTTGQLVDWMVDGVTLVHYAFQPSTGTPMWKVVGSGDLNGDGKPDLVIGTENSNAISVVLNNTP